MKVDKNKIKRILFISLSNIGDIVLTTPAMRILSENFPESRMDIMVGPNGTELFKKHPVTGIGFNKHPTKLEGKKTPVSKIPEHFYMMLDR